MKELCKHVIYICSLNVTVCHSLTLSQPNSLSSVCLLIYVCLPHSPKHGIEVGDGMSECADENAEDVDQHDPPSLVDHLEGNPEQQLEQHVEHDVDGSDEKG